MSPSQSSTDFGAPTGMSQGGPESHGAGQSAGTRSAEDIDDQFRALMEGLRTTIPGVMVLFAFLLTLPLRTAFTDLTGLNRSVFYLAFGSSALAAVLLIAPSVHQRARAPISGIRRRTWAHVMFATRLAIAGTLVFMVAIGAVVYLVSSMVFAETAAAAATTLIMVVTAWAWFYLPLVTFRQDHRQTKERHR